jgi:tripartite-type tricarboxylate transporter receptor subunit TctC
MCEPREFRKSAERNHWDVSFKNAAETRKFMEAEYADFKRVMGQFGLSK